MLGIVPACPTFTAMNALRSLVPFRSLVPCGRFWRPHLFIVVTCALALGLSFVRPATAVIPTEADLAPPNVTTVLENVREVLVDTERLIALDTISPRELDVLRAELDAALATLDRVPPVTDPQVTTRSRNLARQARRPLRVLRMRLQRWNGDGGEREAVRLALEALPDNLRAEQDVGD